MQENMTALVSAFARAWHTEHALLPVHADPLAKQFLGEHDYTLIGQHMAQGIDFFSPGFKGNEEDALAHIVTHHLAPSPVGRSAFWENALKTAVSLGTTQLLILGAGYETFPYRQPEWAKKLTIFELDRPEDQKAKLLRLENTGISIPSNVRHIAANLTDADWTVPLLSAGFSQNKTTFCCLMGLSYYLTRTEFPQLVSTLGELLPPGSSLVFDYPTSRLAQAQIDLAQGAGEPIRGLYTFREMETLLPRRGFLVYEHLTPKDITARFFASHNAVSPHRTMEAAPGVNYCLAVKKDLGP